MKEPEVGEIVEFIIFEPVADTVSEIAGTGEIVEIDNHLYIVKVYTIKQNDETIYKYLIGDKLVLFESEIEVIGRKEITLDDRRLDLEL
jgi:hypothetical protein